MDNNSVALLEFIKFFCSYYQPESEETNRKQFFTMKFSGPIPRDLRIADEKIETPEQFSFFVEKLQFCYEMYTFNKTGETTLQDLSKFSGLKFNIRIGTYGAIIPDLSFRYNHPDTERKCYIFFSEDYKNLKKEIKSKIFEKYGNKDFFENNHSDAFYPYSLLIMIKNNNGSDFENFDNFLALSLDGWKNEFQSAVNIALANNGNFDSLQNYHPEIFIHALSYDHRIAMIKKIAYQEYWGILDFDGLNEQEFILKLLESISDDDASRLFSNIFGDNAALFRKLDGKFDNQANLKFVLLLMKMRYNKELRDRGEKGLEDYLITIPESHTVPVRKVKMDNGVQYIGPDPIIELKNSTAFLKDIRFEKGDGTIIDFSNTPNPFAEIFQEYPYEEMLKVYIWFENKQLGLAQGRIIPMPAFAIKAFHKGISDEITVLDVINKAVEIVGLIIPYIKLIELVQIGSRWYKIVGAGVAAFEPIASMYISSPIVKQGLEKSYEGKLFLQGYNYISFIYANKDLAGSEGIFELISKIVRGNKLAFKDGENLLTLWSSFFDTPDFNVLDAKNIQDFNNIKSQINQVEFEINHYHPK